jgi:hypothetical protein
MSERAYKMSLAGIALYALVAVVCFGPATVESERAQEKHLTECKEKAQPEQQTLCMFSGPRISDGAPKAFFWPLWLSYRVASGT